MKLAEDMVTQWPSEPIEARVEIIEYRDGTELRINMTKGMNTAAISIGYTCGKVN